MFNTLFGKISLTLFMIFIVLGAFLVLLIDTSAFSLQEETTQKLHQELAKNIVVDVPLWKQGEIDSINIKQAFHTMMMLGPAIELYVVSTDGELLTYDAPEEKIARHRIDMAPITQFLSDDPMLPVQGDDPRSPDSRKIFSVAPIYLPDTEEIASNIVAYLYIIIGGEEYDSVFAMTSSSRILDIASTSLIVGLSFFLMAALLLFYLLTKPIRQITQTMIAFRESNFLKAPEIDPNYSHHDRNELHQLYSVFREISGKIVYQFDEMIRNRHARQELISQISHDLMTPLASTRGYLESLQILNEEVLLNDEAKKCIDTAINNCDLQKNLVEELFEFSRLETNDIEPNIETFPLTELVEDIIQAEKIKADKKQILLNCISPKKTLYVQADIAHINRVFTNLLDNAIRHTPAAGQILVTLKLNADSSIDVKITDTGSGIAEQELSQLFEPYFRASNQETRLSQGSGLGLAITKRLLNLNGIDIRVESKLNIGTSFFFTMPSFST